MSARPQLFRIEPSAAESKQMQEVDFARLGFQERRDIQEWVAANPGILGDDLLVIGKEFSGFDRTNERLDLLAVDQDGRLVVIELKRDDTGADAHWQAIKYASYLRRASVEHIVEMLANYRGVSEEDAANTLQQHLGADDLNALNNDQRIILASHRFAPEVTSAALWLNERAHGDNLITCIQLIPYQDDQTDSLYVQANTIIPVPGEEDYMVGIGESTQAGKPSRRTSSKIRNDGVTHFLRRVGEIVRGELVGEISPDRRSRWARKSGNARYYSLWYSRPPWYGYGTRFTICLIPEDGSESWKSRLEVWYENEQRLTENGISVADWVDAVECAEGWPRRVQRTGRVDIETGVGELNDGFGDQIAEKARCIIKVITPIVDEFEDTQDNEEDA